MNEHSREPMTPEGKKKALFLRQKQTLDLFLERNAIMKKKAIREKSDRLFVRW